ncbi:hypothetical protein [Actinospica robiniae]|uniref:hypothetical protein n=1 Tax=Actinospica robiniae TaxID=304901 RepID=UPI00054F2A30|nr:hypothetical protein [Actinospica robiniae]
MAWIRGRDDEQQPGFSIEFEDEDEGLDAAAWDEALQSGEAAGAEVVRGHRMSRWARMPRRARVGLAAGVLALAAGSVALEQGVRSAQERARDRYSLAVVGDHYQPVIFSYGLNMSLTLVDNGPAPVTVEFLQVSQPGLSLDFYPVNVPLPVGKPTTLALNGVFDCERTASSTAAAGADKDAHASGNASAGTKAGADANASTVDVTVSSRTGIGGVRVGLAAGSVPPQGWQDELAAFCAPSPVSNTGR